MTRISSALVLAAALAFMSSAVSDASAATLPTRDVAESNGQLLPDVLALDARDANEQNAADASNKEDATNQWWCPWNTHWSPGMQRCVPNWRPPIWQPPIWRPGPGPWSREENVKRDELVARDPQGGPGGYGGGYGGYGGRGGYGGGGYGGYGGRGGYGGGGYGGYGGRGGYGGYGGGGYRGGGYGGYGRGGRRYNTEAEAIEGVQAEDNSKDNN
ncbi:uncharacterized protein UTRI_01964 [Ustilago trichophora]|uniref:Glycine-rich protein n=1 Tax=Ustilago trichophora TaxID=86804 RepID=A0A5C3E1B0_9BASI|nr:uncharacterized protein UTRI_01964 [Ustilago trichophora]